MSNAELLSVEYFTSHPMDEFRKAHEVALPLWESGQPVPALHRPVARLRPSQEVLGWLEGDVRALGEEYDDEQLLLEDPEAADFYSADSLVPPRLTAFLRTARDYFAQIVRTDLGVDERTKEVAIGAGPYDGHPDFYNWHRDFKKLGGVTYVLAMLGRPTIYSLENTRSADFDKRNNLLPARTPHNTMSYDVWTVSAHHSTFTAHRGPGPETNGHARLLFNHFADDAL